MIAFTIALTWLIFTAVGFRALTALGGVDARDDFELDLESHASGMFVSADTLSGLPSTAAAAMARTR